MRNKAAPYTALCIEVVAYRSWAAPLGRERGIYLNLGRSLLEYFRVSASQHVHFVGQKEYKLITCTAKKKKKKPRSSQESSLCFHVLWYG